MLGSSNSSPILLGNLSISLNGTKALDYNGLNNKTLNITAASIGAAASNHTHDSLVCVIKTTNTNVSDAGKYTKIITATIAVRYGHISVTYSGIFGGQGTEKALSYRFNLWIKQQEAFGQLPYISMIVNHDSHDTIQDPFRLYAIIDELSATATKLSIYIKQNARHTSSQMFIMNHNINKGVLEYFNNQELITTLPESVNGVIVPSIDYIIKYNNIVIPVASWNTTSKAYTYSNDNITANHCPEVMFAAASIPAASESGIIVHTEDGKLILTCTKSIPTVALTIDTVILTLVA